MPKNNNQASFIPLPEAFGPVSWYGTPDNLIPIYRNVRWHKDEPLDPGETVDPLDLEEETSPPSKELEPLEQ